ncbi:hypothetical protein ABKN59_002903 [Abortiporus biennis]
MFSTGFLIFHAREQKSPIENGVRGLRRTQNVLLLEDVHSYAPVTHGNAAELTHAVKAGKAGDDGTVVLLV